MAMREGGVEGDKGRELQALAAKHAVLKVPFFRKLFTRTDSQRLYSYHADEPWTIDRMNIHEHARRCLYRDSA